MGTISTTIRDIDEPLYRKFRAKCVEKNMKTGEALNEAIRLWLEKQEESEKPVGVQKPIHAHASYPEHQEASFAIAESPGKASKKK